jgi:hypothetical protein
VGTSQISLFLEHLRLARQGEYERNKKHTEVWYGNPLKGGQFEELVTSVVNFKHMGYRQLQAAAQTDHTHMSRAWRGTSGQQKK